MNPAHTDYYIAVGFIALILLAVGIAGYRREMKASPRFAADWAPEDLTEWHPAEMKPIHVGRYRVRMPWTTVESIQMAEWDGKCWRDVGNGRECYFQNLVWQGIKIQAAAR